MTKVTTFGQSPDTILPTEFNNIQDDYEELFQEYTTIHEGRVRDLQSRVATSAYIMNPYYIESQKAELPVATNQTPAGFVISVNDFFWWDPADYANFITGAGGTRVLKLRLRSVVMCLGATAPGVSFSFGIRAVSSFSGGSVSTMRRYTMASSSVAGFTTTHTTPGANTTTVQSVEMADASTLTPGQYAIIYHGNVAPNASSDCNAVADISLKIE